MENILSFAAFKSQKELKKSDGAKRSRLIGALRPRLGCLERAEAAFGAQRTGRDPCSHPVPNPTSSWHTHKHTHKMHVIAPRSKPLARHLQAVGRQRRWHQGQRRVHAHPDGGRQRQIAGDERAVRSGTRPLGRVPAEVSPRGHLGRALPLEGARCWVLHSYGNKPPFSCKDIVGALA